MATTPTPNVNTVTLKDNYVEIVWDGPQNKQKVEKSNQETIAAAQQLAAQKKPILLSFDIQNHPLKPDMGAYSEVLKMFRSPVTFDRVAVSGSVPHTIATLAGAVIDSFNSEVEIRFIEDKAQALAWLLADKNS